MLFYSIQTDGCKLAKLLHQRSATRP